MRQTDPLKIAHRATRTSIHADILVWISARNRTTGAIETIGLWSGDDHQIFRIDGQDRLYYGAGNLLECEPIQATTGLAVRSYELRLAANSPEMQLAIRGYDPRFAPVEIHRAEYNAAGALLGAPERLFRGWIDEAPMTTGADGDDDDLRLRVVSEARALTLFSGATKSDAVQSRRGGDRFRRYGSVVEQVEVAWGEHRRGGK
ncbi:MAG: hypothetical protein Q4G14_14945 [Paracoccus sp. (in: a-proteobacteria)]|uniref:hypothetical protein n=1 Tax=Paracoccus sp. TaxID=267 RepID=UPI0026DEDCBE|nr:hypothetical protein [Paracoccus sp. (in: a-proteobacteria)]MDO5614523.1 hypothetical protein [Paracoccus sp. (in: a-proteobacteria)]